MSNPPSYDPAFDESFDYTSTAPEYSLSFYENFDETAGWPEFALDFLEPFDLVNLPEYELDFLEPFDYGLNPDIIILPFKPNRLVRIEAGESEADHSDILNCKSIKWHGIHAIMPRLLPGTKEAVDFTQSCQWVEGEFELRTDDAMFATYAPPDAEAVIIPYFEVFAEDTEKNLWRYVFENLIISSIEHEIDEDKEPITTYRFSASKFALESYVLMFTEHFDYREPRRGRLLFSEGFNS